ncbi:MAG TPA: hypothetical protein VHC22_11370 [Pirellulales bacterium]|nr:hypothetical protein [Pirellulales bacterium]
MRWPTAMLLAALVTAGCHSTQPTFDPFFPKTRIPPPPTGAATGAPDASYTSPAPPFTPSAPPAGGSYAPPGGFPYQQSPTPAPGSGGYVPGPAPTGAGIVQPTGNVSLAQYRTAAGTSTAGQPSQSKRSKYVPTVDDQPSPVYERGGRRGSVNSNPPAQAADDGGMGAIDIMDLPPVNDTRDRVE